MKKDVSESKIPRIAADALLLFAVLFFPWWISCIIAALGVFIFEDFFEPFFAGILLDALYGTQEVNVHGFYLFFTALFFGIVIVGGIAKEKMRF